MGIDPKAKIGGLLLAAYKSKKIVKPEWVDITVRSGDKALGDLIVTVASDAFKAPAGDQKAVRLGLTFKDTIEICRGMQCVVPTVPIFDAMWDQADVQLPEAAMGNGLDLLDYSLKFNDKVEEMLKSKGAKSGDLVFGAWKLWILDATLPKGDKHAAMNRGFWWPAKKEWRNKRGLAHNDIHVDYSQVLQPVKRMAKKKADKSDVDLLDVFARVDKVPQVFLDMFDA